MKRFILILACIFACSAIFAQNDMQTVITVKLTKTEPITVKQLKNEIALMEAQVKRPLSADEKNQALDVIINQRLVLQAAERDRVSVSEGEINQQIDKLKAFLAQQAGRQPTETEFAQAIRSEYDLDMPAFREQLRRRLIMEKYLMSKKEDVFKTVKAPTPSEIQDFYDLNRASLVRPDTVRVSMIQVPFGSDKAAARRTADNLVKEIGGSVSKFDEVALRGSPSGSFQSGAGYLSKNPEGERGLGADALKSAFALKQGQVSGVLESSPRNAYLIMKITETYEQKQLGLDDVIDLGSKITVRQYITTGLSQQKQNDVIMRAEEELYTELRKGTPWTIDRRYLPW